MASGSISALELLPLEPPTKAEAPTSCNFLMMVLLLVVTKISFARLTFAFFMFYFSGQKRRALLQREQEIQTTTTHNGNLLE